MSRKKSPQVTSTLSPKFETFLDRECSPSTCRTYMSAIRSLLSRGVLPGDHNPAFADYTKSSGSAAVYKTAWRHYQAFLSAERMGGSVISAERALYDARVAVKRHPSCLRVHGVVCEALRGISGRSTTWHDVTKALVHAQAEHAVTDAYISAWPWLQAEHARDGLLPLPDFEAEQTSLDPLTVRMVHLAKKAGGARPWALSWGSLTPRRREGVNSHWLGGKGGVSLPGDDMWAMAGRHGLEKQRSLFFACKPSAALIVVGADGYPLSARDWEAHLRATPPENVWARAAEDALPKDVLLELNKREDPAFDMSGMMGDLEIEDEGAVDAERG